MIAYIFLITVHLFRYLSHKSAFYSTYDSVFCFAYLAYLFLVFFSSCSSSSISLTTSSGILIRLGSISVSFLYFLEGLLSSIILFLKSFSLQNASSVYLRCESPGIQCPSISQNFSGLDFKVPSNTSQNSCLISLNSLLSIFLQFEFIQMQPLFTNTSKLVKLKPKHYNSGGLSNSFSGII